MLGPDAGLPSNHPVVGSWVIDVDDQDPDNPPALAIFGADGTYIELNEREPDGAGQWSAVDGQTVVATSIYHIVDENLALEGIVMVSARLTVTGDTFTAPYTLTFMTPNGEVMDSDPGTATGIRSQRRRRCPSACRRQHQAARLPP
jgi:hypothetical protein